jgi:uncharacterized membrane protein
MSVFTATKRLNALDAHRGLIMVLMAIDHGSYYIARAHSSEFWGVPLPVYPDALWFWTRFVTHLCAPGFFLLMGGGMTLMAASRLKTGWSENRITHFFAVRGVLLILLQFLAENTAWMFGGRFAAPVAMTVRGGVPGSGGGTGLYFGVLFALGATMIFWAFARRLPSSIVALISLIAIFFTQWAMPSGDHHSYPYSPLLRILLIPGHTNGWTVFYPLIPWLGATGLGLLFGRLLLREPFRFGRIMGSAAAFCLILFVLVRGIGSFGNLNDTPPGWMGFLNVVKYPPSLSFLTLTLGINFVLIALWMRFDSTLEGRFRPLLVFGRAPLFFYLAHLWLFAALGILFPKGGSLAATYLIWFLALVLLYPLCSLYAGFKGGRPSTSLWRFL